MLRGPGQSVGIIGGSIAALVAGIGLRRRGYDVTILERALHPHDGRGVGIALPGTLVKKCIDLNLFDVDIPRLQTSSRSFLIKDSDFLDNARRIWTQPLFLTPFNWTHIYSNLRKRFPDEQYLYGQKVIEITQDHNKCYVKTSDSSVHTFDRLIGADGVGSIVRSTLFPETSLQYANYIAWRGLIDDQAIVNNDLFNSHGPCYMFSNGHLLMYRIPAPDYATTGKMLLNWVMYEYRKDVPLNVLLTDKDGKQSSISIPPGMLSEERIDYLHVLAHKVLPFPLAETICQTSAPFVQAVFDYQAPEYVVGRICLLGDAANTKRPHSGAGLGTAIESGISLAEAMDPSVEDIDLSLKLWSNTQVLAAEKQTMLAKQLGCAMVTEPPKWEIMDQESTSLWWNDLMQGKNWYAIDSKSVENDLFESKSHFTPKMNAEVSDLCNDLSRSHLESVSTLPSSPSSAPRLNK